MGVERPGLQEFLKTEQQDTTENVDVVLPDNESVQKKAEAKNKKKEFDINKVSNTIQNAVENRRAEKQIALLEAGREDDLTEEEKNALDQELRQYALDLLLKEKKKHRKENIENSGPLVRYYHKFNKWYDSLEDTPRGRVGRKFLESGLTGSLFLGTATAVGLVPPNIALTQLGARVVTATTFRAVAASTMNFLTKKRPEFVKKITNLFSAQNQTTTPPVEFKSENTVHTGVPNFSAENINTTLENKTPSIDFRKMKYAGIALGTSFVFLMGGWVAATATGVALVSKEQLSDMLKRKIQKYEQKINELSGQINLDSTSATFLANMDQVSQELDKLTKTIQELEVARGIIKGTVTYANGLIGADLGLPGGGSVRRLATDPADELKITSKKILKAEKKEKKINQDQKLAA